MTPTDIDAEIERLRAAVDKMTPGEFEASSGFDGEPDRWIVTTVDTLRARDWVVAMIHNGAPGDTLKTEEANACGFAMLKNTALPLIDRLRARVGEVERELETARTMTPNEYEHLRASEQAAHEAKRNAEAKLAAAERELALNAEIFSSIRETFGYHPTEPIDLATFISQDVGRAERDAARVKEALRSVERWAQFAIDNCEKAGIDASDEIRVREIARAALAPPAPAKEEDDNG